MNLSLLRVLRCPVTREELNAHAFVTVSGPRGTEDIGEGILVARLSQNTYAVRDGIPIMFPGGLPSDFSSRYSSEIRETLDHPVVSTSGTRQAWSFSTQWQTHAELGVDRTWGFTAESRVEQMLLETCLPREFFRGKVLLDAGCGNGKLTQQITTLGAETVGIDFSDSVVQAHARRSSPNVHYVRGDLQRPPFAAGAFDVVVSNGVLHHTPNTERAFQAVATCVRDGGAFYMWLYSKPESFVRRYLYYGGIDSVRAVASRLPPGGKRAVARAAAYLARAKYQTSGKTVDSETFNELIIGLMDTLTPRWRHYHTPVEVARWYFEAGFGAPTVSHWDNPYGFGVVATKQRLVATPGSNFDEQWSRRDAAKPPESLPAATA